MWAAIFSSGHRYQSGSKWPLQSIGFISPQLFIFYLDVLIFGGHCLVESLTMLVMAPLQVPLVLQLQNSLNINNSPEYFKVGIRCFFLRIQSTGVFFPTYWCSVPKRLTTPHESNCSSYDASWSSGAVFWVMVSTRSSFLQLLQTLYFNQSGS